MKNIFKLSSILLRSSCWVKQIKTLSKVNILQSREGLLWGKKGRDDRRKSYKTTLKNTKP